MALASKAYAFIKRRGYVIPEDVRAVCHDILRHRIGLTYEAEAENVTTDEVVNEILNAVEVPWWNDFSESVKFITCGNYRTVKESQEDWN